MATPDTIFAKSYGSVVFPLAQQKGSKLRNTVMVKTGVQAEETYMDQMTAFEVKIKGSRLAQTNPEAVDFVRRRIALQDPFIAKGLDKQDNLKTLADPTSAVVQSGIMGMGRRIDKIIYDAALGTANTGKVGGTQVVLPAGQKIANGGTGMTLAKWRQAIKILNANDFDDNDRVLVITATALEDLLSDSTITSADFNTVRALVDGQINSFLGCRVIRLTEKIITTTANIQNLVLFQKSALGVAFGQDIQSRVTEESTLHFSKQLYFSMSVGASRLDEEGVVEIGIDVTA